MLATGTFYNYFVHNIEREVLRNIHCGVFVVVQFYPWFKFSFLLFLVMAMYDNNTIMSLKQKKRKFEPRTKLNQFTYETNPYSKSELSSSSTWWPMPPFFCS